MSDMIDLAVAALEKLPIRDRSQPCGELDKLRLREAARAIIVAVSGPSFAEAVAKVFTRAIVDAHSAARKDDQETRAKFTAVANALETAYPQEVADAESKMSPAQP